VLRQVEGFVAAGGNELVLSGINLGRWGRDLESTPGAPRTLAQLVGRILDQTDLPRLRLSSIEPMDWEPELIELMSQYGGARIARHAHLPLQSGSDAVLRRMQRRYRPWHYADKVRALARAAGPELTLGADVMVGFPGETDDEFQETVDLIRALPFGYLHLFPFSPRPGTRGWELHKNCPVSARIINERMGVLQAISADKSLLHRSQFPGRSVHAITLHTPTEQVRLGKTAALAENFIPVVIEGCLAANRLIRLHITGLTEQNALAGRIEVEVCDRADAHAAD
jgi:threonylcarbamoyladenosine tRNA methylthiotransferase MtaB